MSRILATREAHGAIEVKSTDYGEHSYPSGRDAADMANMGIKQETKRRFGFVTILGFTTCMMATWESALPFFTTAFINGGGPTMLYGYLVAFLGALATCASMAEMASMYVLLTGSREALANRFAGIRSLVSRDLTMRMRCSDS